MAAEQLTPDSVIRRSETIISSNLGEEVVMMDIEDGSYYAVEKVAARIWELTEQPIAIGVLCERLTGEYSVPAERCREELVTFVGELVERRIVQLESAN